MAGRGGGGYGGRGGYGGYGGGRGPPLARPENALKRADELINVGQKGNALQVLHDIVTSKKHRTWSKTYESIMFKHIDLVVDMKKRNYGKEALMQYRNMCQAVNINSLEEVIKYYLKKASDKAEEAQNQAAATITTIDVADLEEDASPEDIMLSYVSGDKSKDRTDRELVTPWFRFLWEAYRSVLEILRTNPKLEPVYAMTACKAFHFCLQFKRTAEFRRLSDILRQHLTNLHMRYRENPNPDTLVIAMETRFEQLKVACELEMWAEAFRSVEDIQALIMLSKRTPAQKHMATYYARLTQIFAVSENHLYHGYAWLKLFMWSRKEHKNLTPSDLHAMSSSVVLAMLSILPYDVRQGQPQDELSVEQEKERVLRMASILGFPADQTKDYRNVLSRHSLLSAVSNPQMLALVPPEVKQIYDLLSNEFNPLELCNKMAPLLAKLEETTFTMSPALPVPKVALSQYVSQLKQVTVLRLLKQLSEVFSTMRISTLASLVPFMPLSEVEAVVVDAVKCDYLQVRIDHRHGTIQFGAQQLESERVRTSLQQLSQRLSKAVTMIGVPNRAEHEAKRAKAIATAMEQMSQLHGVAIARKVMIEKRKEEQETMMLEAEREAEQKRIQMLREAEAAEERRRREEALRREKERIEKELAEREMEELAAMHESFTKAKGGSKVASKVAQLKSAEDKEAFIREIHSDRIKAQEESERKMARIARQLDHLERARREEEAPYLAELAEARMSEERALHEEAVRLDSVRHREAWEQDVAIKAKLMVTLDDKPAYETQIMTRRKEEFEELRRQRYRKAADRKAKRRAEVLTLRRQRYLEQCIEEVDRRVEEIEEEEAIKAKAEKQREDEERQRKLQEIAEKQRQREAELEAKQREEKGLAGTAPSAAPSAPAPSAAGKFVPRHLRGADGPPAAAPGRAFEPSSRADPPREDRWGGGGGGGGGPPPPRREDDRWGGGGGGGGGAFGASRRDDGPPARDLGRAPPPTAAPSAPAPAASSGGKFVPPHLRNRQ